MKTEALLTALTVDAKLKEPRPSWLLAAAVAGGFALAAILFMFLLGPRPDFSYAMQTPRFVFKFVVSLTLAASGTAMALLLMRPESDLWRWKGLLFAAPLLLAIAIGMELWRVPGAMWMPRMMGHNAFICMMSIPALSLVPLGAILMALRHGATISPARAGAVAGLVAAGLGAALYAAHCTDDSPLFVAAWYTLATLIVAAIGSSVGARVLRW